MAANTKKPPTKSEIYAKIVEDTGLTRKDVAAVFDSLNAQIKKNLGGRGAPGLFTVPGLLKMRVVKKPARKARKGVNPFTGEEMMFKAKPATQGRQGDGAQGPERHGLSVRKRFDYEKAGLVPAFFIGRGSGTAPVNSTARIPSRLRATPRDGRERNVPRPSLRAAPVPARDR